MPSQAIVLHEHGDITNHAHRVAEEELSNWHTVHADRHATWPAQPDMPVPIVRDVTIESVNMGTHGTVITVNVVSTMLPSSPSRMASMARLSCDIPTVYAWYSSNLQRPPQLSFHSATGVAPSSVTAILRINHTLLV
jgi:hypothetical protein